MSPTVIVYAPIVKEYIRHLHPATKSPLRAMIEQLRNDPTLGKPLLGEFEGLRSLRYKRYRVIYRYQHAISRIEIIFTGPRANVYRQLAKRFHTQR